MNSANKAVKPFAMLTRTFGTPHFLRMAPPSLRKKRSVPNAAYLGVMRGKASPIQGALIKEERSIWISCISCVREEP